MKRLIFIAILAFLGLRGFAQKQLPITVGIGNEATAIPFTKIFSVPVHPTVQIGTDFTYGKRDHHRLFQTINLGYIYHRHLYQGVYLSTELGYDYVFSFGLKLKGLFGLGYLHSFSTQEEYQLKDGEYVNGKDFGNARLMPSLSLGLGYQKQVENPTCCADTEQLRERRGV